MQLSEVTADWFFQRFDVDSTTGCWVWRMKPLRNRYGNFTVVVDGTICTVQAHRCAWELFVGPIPEDLFVLHECDYRPCVNPEHLFLGTQSDNIHDAYAKGHLRRGDARTDTKLTEADVVRIKELHAAAVGLREIGRQFGVSHSLVSLILAGKRRQHG